MTKILLVEDNEMNRDMLSRRLTRNGYEIVMAVNGQEGLDLASSENPDLILLDMSLPVIDGWEAARRLKADAATAKIPVIALTAHAHGSRQGKGAGRWLRRLRYQAGGTVAVIGKDQDAVAKRRLNFEHAAALARSSRADYRLVQISVRPKTSSISITTR